MGLFDDIVKPKADESPPPVARRDSGLFSDLTSGAVSVDRQKSATGLERVLDALSTGTYASAGFTRGLLQGENPLASAVENVRSGHRTYGDLLREQGVDNPWVSGVGGFIGDVVLDPVTYTGFGALTKAGRATRGAAVAGEIAARGTDATKAAQGLADAAKFGGTLAEQGARGQRAAVSFAGRSVLPDVANKAVLGAVDKVGAKFGGTSLGKNLREKFVALPELHGVERDAQLLLNKQANVAAKRAQQEFAASLNASAESILKTANRYSLDRGAVVNALRDAGEGINQKLLEGGVHETQRQAIRRSTVEALEEFAPEARTALAPQFRSAVLRADAANASTLAAMQAQGLDVVALRDAGVGYVHRLTRPEAVDALRKAGLESHEVIQSIMGTSTAAMQTRGLKGVFTTEINRLAEAGELVLHDRAGIPVQIPAIKGGLFEPDLFYSTLRHVESGVRVAEHAKMLPGMVARYNGRVVDLGEAEAVRDAGYKRLRQDRKEHRVREVIERAANRKWEVEERARVHAEGLAERAALRKWEVIERATNRKWEAGARAAVRRASSGASREKAAVLRRELEEHVIARKRKMEEGLASRRRVVEEGVASRKREMAERFAVRKTELGRSVSLRSEALKREVERRAAAVSKDAKRGLDDHRRRLLAQGMRMVRTNFNDLHPIQELWMPAPVADVMNGHFRAMANPGQARRLLQSANRVWKLTATAPYPAFHIRNFEGDIWNGWVLGGANIRSLYDSAALLLGKKAGIKVGGRLVPREEVIEQAARNGVYDGGFMQDFFAHESEMLGGMPKSGLDGAADVVQGSAPMQLAMKVGRARENHTRLALFIDRLGKGDTPEVAALFVKEHLFDYSELTDFERGLKDALPFFAWTRFNAPLQLKYLAQKPGAAAAVQKARLELAGAQGKEGLGVDGGGDLPRFLQEGLPVPVGRAPSGEEQFLRLEGTLPLADLSMFDPGNFTQRVIGMATPVVGQPFETLTGIDTFKSDFERGDIRFVEDYPGQQTSILGLHVNKRFFGDPLRTAVRPLDFLDRMNPGGVFGTSEEQSYGGRPLPFGTEGTVRDYAEPSGMTRALSATVGRSYAVDADAALERKLYEAEREISKLERTLDRAEARGDNANAERIMRRIERIMESVNQ